MAARIAIGKLRLPVSIKAEAARQTADDATAPSQSVAMTVAETVAALRIWDWFAQRRGGATTGR